MKKSNKESKEIASNNAAYDSKNKKDLKYLNKKAAILEKELETEIDFDTYIAKDRRLSSLLLKIERVKCAIIKDKKQKQMIIPIQKVKSIATKRCG